MRQLLIINLLCLCLISMKAQISVVSINLQSFNVVPEALLNVGIMNGEGEQNVQLITQVFNSTNTLLLQVKSQPFLLLKGLNAGLSGERKVASTEYSNNQQANYLKSTHSLPSGRYKVCSSLMSVNGADKLYDFCDEFEADFNQYLYLVNPPDNDTVDSKNPVLIWAHSEPFSILSQGEFYRMIVTPVNKDQTSEEAINVNSPVMIKNYLKEHQLTYPYDAKELQEGQKYAWQVQKIGDGVVINKTEAWTFNLRISMTAKSLKYVALKTENNGDYYTAYNGEVFFKFNEDYKTGGNLKFKLFNHKSENIQIEIDHDADQDRSKDKTSRQPAQLKYPGDNRFELDLDAGKLKSGFYTLEVQNEKKEKYYLKIFLP
jgi:hypothetical protein